MPKRNGKPDRAALLAHIKSTAQAVLDDTTGDALFNSYIGLMRSVHP